MAWRLGVLAFHFSESRASPLAFAVPDSGSTTRHNPDPPLSLRCLGVLVVETSGSRAPRPALASPAVATAVTTSRTPVSLCPLCGLCASVVCSHLDVRQAGDPYSSRIFANRSTPYGVSMGVPRTVRGAESTPLNLIRVIPAEGTGSAPRPAPRRPRPLRPSGHPPAARGHCGGRHARDHHSFPSPRFSPTFCCGR